MNKQISLIAFYTLTTLMAIAVIGFIVTCIVCWIFYEGDMVNAPEWARFFMWVAYIWPVVIGGTHVC